MLKYLRNMLCRHVWQVSKYQALIDDGDCDFVCAKCGKITRKALKGGAQ